MKHSIERIAGLPGCGLAYQLALLVESHSKGVLAVVPDPLAASRLEQELSFFLPNLPILNFPDWETLPYDSFSPHQDIISDRLSTLYQLSNFEKGILIVPISTLAHRLCPREFLVQSSLILTKGEIFDLKNKRSLLEQAGYRCVSEVREHGEFAVRGAIVDLFPMGHDTPFRIDLFDNEIDSIRSFDPDSQRSLEKKQQIRLLPGKEFPLTPEAISKFRSQWREQFEGNPQQCPLYSEVSEGRISPGIEYYLPLFFEKTASLFEYLPAETLVVGANEIEAAANRFFEQVKERYENYRHDRLKPILVPTQLFFSTPEIFAALKSFSRVMLTQTEQGTSRSERLNQAELSDETEQMSRMRTIGEESSSSVGSRHPHALVEPLPRLTLEAGPQPSLAGLNEFLTNFKGRILFVAESQGRLEVFRGLLEKVGCHPTEVTSWADFLQSMDPYCIAIAGLEEGMCLTSKESLIQAELIQTKDLPTQNGGPSHPPLAVIPEALLLGKRVLQTRRRSKQRAAELDFEVRSLAELNLNDPVVHIDYGIGRYLGLSQLTLGGQEAEFITLEYAGGDKLYVPVSSIHLLSRYSGVDLEHAPLHRLGTAEWQKVKRKVLEQTRDVAAELLEIYAKREMKTGLAFPSPDEEYRAFSSEFPFEETFDQQQAIEQVIRDLTRAKPMDRVICGDVGFGKTEVALRAAFLAVQGRKQVAVLVPTTLLAQQHYQTFCDRFARFPFRIEVLSRFRSRKEQESVIEAVAAGKVDILIGTHKILQGQIQFKDLGLLIIDEEHRFGVRQKEAFKALRSELDILTLTATPIPRTLNMAMSGIRDLSIIATPPAKRLSVKTFVREKSPALIQEAIQRELHRGGQVYYLHNYVETIDKCASDLQQWVGEAKIKVAHGQMRERELEQVMLDFYHRRFNVLVCTTIIETGIDIPTANTIIIERADKFGLAQLHQLRGRVGRSHHQAYAFCLTASQQKIGSDAKKRLEAIESLDELGVGFTLATHDLEIRGAGELLGEEQSGSIQSVGFPLYMELLEHTVQALREGADLDIESSFKKRVEIELKIPAFIPESYLPDVHSRLLLYKRIASVKSASGLEELRWEIQDRFGILPPPTLSLLKLTELRLIAEPLGIIKIEAGPHGGRLEFGAQPKVNPQQIIALLQGSPDRYQLEGPQKLKLRQDLSDPKVRLEAVQGWVASLKPPSFSSL